MLQYESFPTKWDLVAVQHLVKLICITRSFFFFFFKSRLEKMLQHISVAFNGISSLRLLHHLCHKKIPLLCVVNINDGSRTPGLFVHTFCVRKFQKYWIFYFSTQTLGHSFSKTLKYKTHRTAGLRTCAFISQAFKFCVLSVEMCSCS